MADGFLTLQREGPVAAIVLNRPEKRNAISKEMWEEMAGQLTVLEEDRTVKVIVIRSQEEQSFSAGADIGQFSSVRESSESAKAYDRTAYQFLRRLGSVPKPTIAMIRGYCMGAGLELSLMCDFRMADRSAIFAITPAKLGMVYHFSGVQALVHQVGSAYAKDLLFSARRVDAEEAYRIGLIERLVEPEALEKEVYTYAGTLANRSPVSIRGVKRIVEKIKCGLTEADEECERLVSASLDGPDYKAGIEAFLHKKTPVFE